MHQNFREKVQILQKRLELLCGCKVDIRLNRNRSTMLSVLERSSHRLRASIHQLFLDSPPEILTAVADFLRKGKNSPSNRILDQYIHQHLPKQDFSQSLDPKRLDHQGRFFNLAEIYEEVCEEYFDGSLGLHITWFGDVKKRPQSRALLGSFVDTLKLIKIHRRLDRKVVPREFLKFVVYHEIGHFICEPTLGPDGRNQFHHADFRELEKAFRGYTDVLRWERENRHLFFA